MRGVVGDLWGIVSIAHSVKSDEVEDVGGMGMYVEPGEGMSVCEVGEGGSGRVALQRRAKICRCCSLPSTNVSRRFAAARWWDAEACPKMGA